MVQIDWRALLDSIKVPWADRGKNTTAGNINIACPWCRNDPSHHLGIAENKEAYYCYREPDRHSGRNFIRLLIALRFSRDESIRLLNYYRRREIKSAEEPKKREDPEKLRLAWDRFAPAYINQRCLSYLAQRGFLSPRTVCEQFDLRVAQAGVWANRLLFPFAIAGQVRTWSGRALSPGMDPKYLNQSTEGYAPIYAPDAAKSRRETLVIVEGPMDALKVADACRRLPIIVAALAGKNRGPSKLLQVRALAEGCDRVLVALDADVAMSSAYQTIAEIAQAIKPRYIGRARIPIGYKDPGEIPTKELLSWLAACNSTLK